MLSPRPRQIFYGGIGHILRLFSLLFVYCVTGKYWKDQSKVGVVERKIAGLIPAKHLRLVPQARFGIYLCLKVLIKPGQEVLMSPYTIADVVNMVICAGGRPVFVDISRGTCHLDCEELEAKVHANTRAVIFTHLHGFLEDLGGLSSFCKKHGLLLIEDRAQVFGATVDGKPAGVQGDVGIFSFGRVKNVNGFFGGAIASNNEEIVRKIDALLRRLPRESVFKLLIRGCHCLAVTVATCVPLFQLLTFPVFQFLLRKNVRSVTKTVRTEEGVQRKNQVPTEFEVQISPVQAALIDRQLAMVSSNNAKRISSAEQYFQGLEEVDSILLPPRLDDGSHIYLCFPIQVQSRWKLEQFLSSAGRDVAVAHMRNAASLETFSEFSADCPIAEEVSRNLLFLPTYPGYPADEIVKNISAIKKFFVMDRETCGASKSLR